MKKDAATLDFERFFNSLPNPYIAFLPNDPVFTIAAENQAHADVALGAKRVDVIGKPVFEVFPDNSDKFKTTGISDLLESFRKVIKTGKPDEMPILKYDLKDKHGDFIERWWRVTHYPVHDDAGKVCLVYQATTDITDELKTSQKLELAQSQLNSALSIGLVSTWSWDITNDIVTGDINLAKSFGVKPELAAKGLPLHIFVNSIHKDDRDRIIAAIQKSITENADYEEEYRTVNSKGEVRWVIARGQLVQDLDGKPGYFMGVIVDITARKQAESELERIKSMFDALFQSTILCIVLADTAGNIHEANKTFLKTFGYSKHDLERGLTSKDLTPIKSRGITNKIYDSIRTKGEAEPTEKEYIRKDGTTIPMMIGAAKLPGSDDLFMAFMLDISENKQLLALNQTKDEFIGMASHQLRTPATAVKQYISLLKTGFAGMLTPEQQAFADKAYASNERQLTIVNDLLKTAQIDSNRYLLKKESVAIIDLVKTAATELEAAIALKHQSLLIQNHAAQHSVFVDSIELNLVLVNLLENASKYSPERTTITVEVGIEDEQVYVAIHDEGVGIALEDQVRIFQKFTRIDNELSDTVSGSGLGLYWVKRILTLHNGTIEIESTPGHGSTFVVNLPYEP